MSDDRNSIDDTISCSSVCGASDVSGWWDDVYEATDLTRSTVMTSLRLIDSTCHTVPIISPNVTSDTLIQSANAKAGEGTVILRAGSEVKTTGLNSQPSSLSEDARVCGGTAVLLAHNFKEIMGSLYPSHFKILTSKVSFNHGILHVNKLGKLRARRQLRSPCHERCKRCDSPKLSAQERRVIFQEFWSLGSHEKQWEFIFHSIKVSTPLRKVAPNCQRKKFSSRSYYFSISDTPRRVCKTMFKNTLCICDSWIESALSHYIPGMPPIPDMRGKWKISTTTSNS